MIAGLFLVAAQVLFTSGVQDAEKGKLDRALLTLQTLVNTYPADPLAASARSEIEAINLYQEGRQRMREGRYRAAEFTFQTLASVYPESPLAKLAEEGARSAIRADEDANVRLTVRSVNLAGLRMRAGEVEKFFAEREVRLAAGRAFDPREVEQARVALTAQLNTQVRAEVRTAGPHEVDVILTRR